MHAGNYCWDLRPSGILRIADWLLPTFRDNLLVPFPRVKKSKKHRQVTTNLRCVTSTKSEDLLYNAMEVWNHELPLLLSFSGAGIYIATCNSRWLVFSRTRRGLNSENSLLFEKTILEWLTGNDVTSQVDARMYVVLSKVEKHVPIWGISWYHRMYNVINEVS